MWSVGGRVAVELELLENAEKGEGAGKSSGSTNGFVFWLTLGIGKCNTLGDSYAGGASDGRRLGVCVEEAGGGGECRPTTVALALEVDG
jgi:hypothetical protein